MISSIIALDTLDVHNLEGMFRNQEVVPADLGQTFMILLYLPDNSLLSFPLCVIGRSCQFHNSYKDFIILGMVTSVVSH